MSVSHPIRETRGNRTRLKIARKRTPGHLWEQLTPRIHGRPWLLPPNTHTQLIPKQVFQLIAQHRRPSLAKSFCCPATIRASTRTADGARAAIASRRVRVVRREACSQCDPDFFDWCSQSSRHVQFEAGRSTWHVSADRQSHAGNGCLRALAEAGCSIRQVCGDSLADAWLA